MLLRGFKLCRKWKMKALDRIFICLFGFLEIAGTVYGQSNRIVFTPQWTPQSQFAGYYVAQAKGFYREEGLEVVFDHPSASSSALNRLEAGNSHIITLQLIQAIKLIGDEVPLVNILQTSQRNSLMIVPRYNNIRSLQDLRGKKVGFWKAGFCELAFILDRKEKLDIEWVPFINYVNLFVSGAIDATLAMSYNEYLQILACGIRPQHVFYFSDLGYDIPEDGLYVTADYYRTHRKEAEAFARASVKGWKWAAQHPEEALDIVMRLVREHHVATNRLQQQRMLENVLELQCERHTATRPFSLQPAHVEKASALLLDDGYIHRPVTYQEITGAL